MGFEVEKMGFGLEKSDLACKNGIGLEKMGFGLEKKKIFFWNLGKWDLGKLGFGMGNNLRKGKIWEFWEELGSG